VTRLDGQLIRPHDIEVLTEPADGSVPATVTKLLRVGFEVRAELTTETSQPWVQLTRGQAEELNLTPERTVWLRTPREATTLVAS
jgi:sulfate transport system ATP-binding protein